MVSCDGCEEWYHTGCVRLSAAAARSMRKYTCPVCASFKVSNSLTYLNHCNVVCASCSEHGWPGCDSPSWTWGPPCAWQNYCL